MKRKRLMHYIKIGAILCGLLYLVVFIFSEILVKNKLAEKVVIDWLKIVGVIVLLISGLIVIAVYAIKFITNCIKNIRFSSDAIFDELDSYDRHWEQTKEYYMNKVNVVNFFYKKGGKIDQSVGNDLKRLYDRNAFLERKIGTEDHLNTCILSVGLSICATFLCNSFEKATEINTIAFIATFVICVLLRYSNLFDKGINEIYKYELSLLRKKITYAEANVIKNYSDEWMLQTRQNVIEELLDKCGVPGRSRNKEIVADIKDVERLELSIDNIGCYDVKEYRIGKKERIIKIPYDKNNKEATEDYKILVEIVKKYKISMKSQ